MKMKSGLFNWLCNALAPEIEKADTNYRKALPVSLRVGAVVYKLLWAATTREVTEGFGIGDSTLYDLLHEVVPVIISVLGCHLSWEEGDAAKKTISENLIRSGIPNVLGVIDCTHIRIQAPSGNGKLDYRNRHGYYSMVMQAVVNSEAKFLDVYIGEPSSMNDCRVLRKSSFYDLASKGSLLKGESVVLPSGYSVHPILLGDAVYPALPWLVCSYKRPTALAMTRDKKMFNHQLSKARIYCEIAFGRLKGTFKEVGWRSGIDVVFLPQVIHACCILYNILVDCKQLDFDAVFNKMESKTLLREQDHLRCGLEPMVDRSATDGLVLRERIREHLLNT